MNLFPGYRRLTFLLTGFLALFLAEAQAQEIISPETKKPRHFIKTAPVHLEEINAAYEFFHKPAKSIQVGAGYLYKLQTNKGTLLIPRATTLKGFSLRLSKRTYTGKQKAAPEGSFRGPLATYRYMVFPEGLLYDTIGNPRNSQLFQQVVSLQYVWGVQRIFKSRWVVDAYTGLGGRVKFAYRYDPNVTENYKMRSREFYGFLTAVGPDWAILLGPSVSLNFALGIVF